MSSCNSFLPPLYLPHWFHTAQVRLAFSYLSNVTVSSAHFALRFVLCTLNPHVTRMACF
ncbi:hypothetical protein K470DRAFT_167969 [Piedraia hortae CBS 480.64]|uniref:Uncharacterized protein n=1 Tax=Piedraia hortae CBS 480.64 TaxID=1314780 RepID=A0A6A7C5W8_9PEZI|nr:hypothetical protein K470DRAFT_167969 [Piedraia hortae CBS 480.64]